MSEDRITLIKTALEDALKPHSLEIFDDSPKHQGHAGAQTGKGHFTIVISSDAFQNKSMVECHRLVYQALGSLMETDIHALSINITETHE